MERTICPVCGSEDCFDGGPYMGSMCNNCLRGGDVHHTEDIEETEQYVSEMLDWEYMNYHDRFDHD